MSDPGPYYRPPGMGYRPPPRRIHWLPIVIGAVFVAVATLILLILLYPASFGIAPSTSPYRIGPFGGVFVLFFILIVVFFIVRVAFWSTRASRVRSTATTGTDPEGTDRTDPRWSLGCATPAGRSAGSSTTRS